MRTVHHVARRSDGSLGCSRCGIPIVHPDAEPGQLVAYETVANDVATMRVIDVADLANCDLGSSNRDH